jgi:hypothetical protein
VGQSPSELDAIRIAGAITDKNMWHIPRMEEDPNFRRVRVATFTASEVEQITGVSGSMLRDWRRRDLIDTTPGRGWKRLGTDDLIQVLVMRLLSERNVAAGFARSMGRMAIQPILNELFAEAYPGDGMELEETSGASRQLQVMIDQQAAALGKQSLQVPPIGTVSVVPVPGMERRYLIYADYEGSSEKVGVFITHASSIEDFKQIARGKPHLADDQKVNQFFVYVTVDLLDVYHRLLDKRIKPYFVEVDA